MEVLELKYKTASGIDTAFVFVDEAGVVTSEKGLKDLIQSLRIPVRHTAADIADFVDLTKPCPNPSLADLRRDYAEEIEKANRDGCTNCARRSIVRKYVHKLSVLNRG